MQNQVAGLFQFHRTIGHLFHIAGGDLNGFLDFIGDGDQFLGDPRQMAGRPVQFDRLIGNIDDGGFDLAFQHLGQSHHLAPQQVLGPGAEFGAFDFGDRQSGPHGPQQTGRGRKFRQIFTGNFVVDIADRQGFEMMAEPFGDLRHRPVLDGPQTTDAGQKHNDQSLGQGRHSAKDRGQDGGAQQQQRAKRSGFKTLGHPFDPGHKRSGKDAAFFQTKGRPGRIQIRVQFFGQFDFSGRRFDADRNVTA